MNIDQMELYKKLTEKMEVQEIQKYFIKMAEIRGFATQSPSEKLLLLIEEVGELAKAIRKEDKTFPIDKEKCKKNEGDSIEGELADVFIVLCTLCNCLNVDLASCILNKEKININRKWS